MKEIEIINKRINALVEDHFVIGGWHSDDFECPTCQTIKKLRNVGLKYLEDVQE